MQVADGQSKIVAVTCRVLQGSVLGPLLFLIYINDLPSIANSRCRLFSEDTLVYATEMQLQQLQADLNTLENWAKA